MSSSKATISATARRGLAAALLAGAVACSGSRGVPASEPAPVAPIREASGVAMEDGWLCVVDDSVPNAYFRIRMPPGAGPLLDLNSLHPEAVRLPLGIWVDLESIGRLADGRMVVLSERLRGLADTQGLVVEYDYPLTEYGRRGLEGLAVRALPDGTSRVAVLWEGGYPDLGSLNPQLELRTGGRPLSPIVFIHDIAPGARPGRVRWGEGIAHAMLEVPVLEGEEPEVQRFRAPDLVWYRFPDREGDEQWGFLVLISSQNRVEPPEYLHHWLQRFRADGTAVGEPLDLAEYVPPKLARANWEGLCWYKEGEELLLVHEAQGDLKAHAFRLRLPAEWQYQAQGSEKPGTSSR